jgi:hypothetical protein
MGDEKKKDHPLNDLMQLRTWAPTCPSHEPKASLDRLAKRPVAAK